MENKRFDLSNRLYYTFLGVCIVFVIVLGISGYNVYKVSQGNQPRTISFSGDGKVYAKPDIAIIELGVTTEGVKSEDAVAKNTDKMNEITKQIKALGVEDKDIQTTNYSLSPKYNYSDGKDSIDGYTLNQDVTIKIRNFDKISSVIQTATSLGANTINQLQFTIENPDAVKAQAIDQAIQKAKDKAKNIADTSGLKLGKLIDVSEGSSGGVIAPTMYQSTNGMGAAPVALPSPAIETGQQEIDVTMNLTYQVN